jgi:hypothetical protein
MVMLLVTTMADDGADVGTRARPPRASASAKGKSIDTASGNGTVVDDTSSKGTTASGKRKVGCILILQ